MANRMRKMISGKIHRATDTGANLHYVGSVTIDADLLDAADILPGEPVDIVDVNNGNRLTAYTIPGERGKGEIILNSVAAHLVTPGDLVIIMCYWWMDDESARTYEPRVGLVDEHNKIRDLGDEPGQVPEGTEGLESSGIPFSEVR